MNTHEHMLEENHVRFYLGKVIKVARLEGDEVLDFIDRVLSPFEIIFSSGNILTECRAVPYDIKSEVNEGDQVIILSFEHIYNNTFYYTPLRDTKDSNSTISIKYGKSKLELVPIDSDNTDILMQATGSNLISISSADEAVNLHSGFGGVNLNSGPGVIDIKNDQTSLHEVLNNLLSEISNIQVLTDKGPAPLMPTSVAAFAKLSFEIDDLLGDNDDSPYLT